MSGTAKRQFTQIHFSQCIVEEFTFFVGLDKRQFISLFHDEGALIE